MDTIRKAIRTLFYDMPLADALAWVEAAHSRRDDGDFLKEQRMMLDVWSSPHLTLTDVEHMQNMVQELWLNRNIFGEDTDGPMMQRIFNLPMHFAYRVLETDDSGDHPEVRFEHLLRWQETSLLVGQDIFTCSLLAAKDLRSGLCRRKLAWPDVLRHNNRELNRMLDRGLCDVHTHLMASGDVFTVNWITAMNHPAKTCAALRKRLRSDRMSQETEFSFTHGAPGILLPQWLAVAAEIRLALADWLIGGAAPADCGRILEMTRSRLSAARELATFQCRSAELRRGALNTYSDLRWDYALHGSIRGRLDDDDMRSPYALHMGERRLMYSYFRRWCDNDPQALDFAGAVYLYLLIKAKFRRELVQTNRLRGFVNFQRYQSRKSSLLESRIKEISLAYAIRTCTADGDKGHVLEGRVAPGSKADTLRRKDVFRDFFGTDETATDIGADSFSIVYHLLKRRAGGKGARLARQRASARKDIRKAVDAIVRSKHGRGRGDFPCTGIDAASSEFDAAPEVFAHAFRYARLRGVKNMTYHAGEDFHDLADGLRAIDETVLFLDLHKGNRIGHALALGVDAHRFYAERHFQAIMPRQMLLDNLVWMKYRSAELGVSLPASTAYFIDTTAADVFGRIFNGPDDRLDMLAYWHGMRLRGDDPADIDAYLRDGNEYREGDSDYSRSALMHGERAEIARRNRLARTYLARYLNDRSVMDNGRRTIDVKVPADFADAVSLLQAAMIAELERLDIGIECCPTSNVRIGRSSRYSQLPMFRLTGIDCPREHELSVSINTDDRGVFGTSLYNEFSLIALALTKERDDKGSRAFSNPQIYGFLQRIIRNNRNQLFTL